MIRTPQSNWVEDIACPRCGAPLLTATTPCPRCQVTPAKARQAAQARVDVYDDETTFDTLAQSPISEPSILESGAPPETLLTQLMAFWVGVVFLYSILMLILNGISIEGLWQFLMSMGLCFLLLAARKQLLS